ncbi:PREDICTED: tyrosine-protein phosphatase non-receptor type 23, partial [Corvus brachyrhynchos]|uniref:tyrosine-protein phosphatase non-receptor type 23 n=1 Tax=Corvus brachyrhynchos TaxID=85066 RepID=UPI000816390C
SHPVGVKLLLGSHPSPARCPPSPSASPGAGGAPGLSRSPLFQFVLKNYGENPENYNEELLKLELLRQSAVSVPRDFEGCSTLRKYLGQLHFLQSRIPMGNGQDAAVPVTCPTVPSSQGMKVSCTHFQCAAGAFTYLRDHFPHSYSVDMSHQILSLNINLMLGQAQECLLEKSMLDNRKSFLVARISAQVVDYYKEACRALENSETASLLGKIQKDWKKLVQMKIYYFAAVAHLHMGKQAEEQQKFGERVIYFQSALDKLNEAIKLAKGQPETVQEALRFTMDVIGGKYNSAKKDNDFIYHEAVPALDTLQSVKGAPLVKALPVNPTDPAVTGPDIFAKLVPMAAHEASSLYSEEKAKLLRDVMAKIEAKNEVLDQFMDSMQLDPETVDNLDMYNHIPPVLMEKCAALSVRPDTVRNLVQSMQGEGSGTLGLALLPAWGWHCSLPGAGGSEGGTCSLPRLLGMFSPMAGSVGGAPPAPGSPPGLAEVSKECSKYLELHEKASFTNTELHRAMNLHLGNLRLLGGPLEQVRAALPTPTLSEDDKQVLQNLKRILAKVQEMRDQRLSLEQQLREMIQKDDITTSLVTTDRSEMKKLFEEQLKKYDQLKVYLEQNLAAQENVLKALTDANVKYAAVRKALAEVEHKWNTTVQTLVASYEAYEDLMKKSQEGKDFYTDLEGKAAKLLERARAACQASEAHRQQPVGDIMPHDRNRVVLRSGKDDYINASRVEDLSPYCPALIATQAPLLGSAADFWLMIYEQKVSVVVMLVSEQELDKVRPVLGAGTAGRGPGVRTPYPVPVAGGLPDSKGSLLRFIQEVHGHYLHQRPLHTPVVVHCSSGVGRTGAFCPLYAAVQAVEPGVAGPALAKPPNSTSPKPSLQQDPQALVLGGDVPISSIQATIAKLSIKPGGLSTEPGEGWGVDPGRQTPAAPPASSSSSLELLASLTPEAFSLDASLKGKQRMNKQNFLQAQPGEGLRGPRPSDDPLSMLDPLWTLNKA